MNKLKNIKKRGKFIVMYGSNNIGKSTQIKLLVDRIYQNKNDILMLKYPIYHLEPTGPRINKILRTEVKEKKSQISENELQKIFAQNRIDFQPILINILNSGINVIAEDYKGTGIAWGLTRSVKLKDLERYNKNLIDPDISILLDGKRFKSGIEKVHRNESNDTDKLEEMRKIHLFLPNNTWERNKQIHLDLAKRYNWEIIKANKSIEEVREGIWDVCKSLF